MAIPGYQQVTAPISPATTTDDQATHVEEFGRGGYRTVADDTERDAIFSERLKEGMLVFVVASGITYRLESDLTTWTEVNDGTLPSDVMLKSVYDPNDDGSVVNSDALQGQTLAQVRNLASMTGSLPQANVTNLVADLAAKIPLTQKGAANGVVPLTAGSLIDPIYLPIASPIDPVLEWNVVTNTPTLADGGVFTAGNAYIVTTSANPTSRNLGSGAWNWYDGDLAIYTAGNVFIRVPRASVSVSSVNGLMGAVSLDTSDIPASTDANYVTDDEDDALNAANSPSASNPIATMADLTSIIVVGNGYFMPELFSDGQTLGDGTTRLLNTLTSPATGVAYTNTSAGNYWTRVNSAYTINVATMTIDWIAWQEAMLAMEQDGYQYIQTPSGRGYIFNQSVILPFDQLGVNINRRSLGFTVDFKRSRCKGTSSFRLFDKYPANQAQATGYQLDYSYDFRDGFLEGFDTSTEADCGIRLGGTTHSTMSNMKFYKFGISFDWQFCLEPTFNNIKVEDYGVYGLRVGDGLWSGATVNIAQSNIATLNTVRCVAPGAKTPTAGMYFTGNSNVVTNQATFEGGNGSVHHVLYDNELATTTKYNLIMRDSYFESAGASRAMVRVMSNSGYYRMDGWTVQGNSVDLPVLFEGESIGLPSADPLYIFLENNPAYMPEGGYKLRNVAQDQKWTVNNVKLPNASSLTNASNWATNFGGTIPSSSMTRFLAPL